MHEQTWQEIKPGWAAVILAASTVLMGVLTEALHMAAALLAA